MSKKSKYVIVSPDGFTIHPTETYNNPKQAKAAFNKWQAQYEKQGYYSSNFGRINLKDLADYCQLKEV
ncbi:MAG: hypothetical protein J0M08_06830 [Bacteroidetes bacterium]|nr:hypothetical protein [Bacteroidota bacterium]